METDVASYVSLHNELLQLEREEEKNETIASGEGSKLSSLESSGLAISRLSLNAQTSDAGGRQVVHLITRGGRALSVPRISTGDLVGIRQLAHAGSSAVVPPPTTTALLTEGIVTGLETNGLYITCDRPLPDEADTSAPFVVLKLGSEVTHSRYTRALSELEDAASDISHIAHNLTQILFKGEKPRFAPRDAKLPDEVEDALKNLNPEQHKAVRNALAAKDLAVIHGPPGTGKTHALIAYIVAEVRRGSRVLVVAPSNVAVDNIAERLAVVPSSHIPRFVRAGHPARIMPTVQPHTLEQQVQRTDEMSLARDVRAELEGLESKICTTCDRNVRRGLRAEQRELRRELRRREKTAVRRLLVRMDVVLATISGAGARVLDIAERETRFDVVVIDEAAQALEASCWVPLLRARKAVLAGDPFQLAGTVKSRVAEERGLKRSILDRVFQIETLAETIVMLRTQYRMNGLISSWSSREFYDGLLTPHESVATRRVADLDTLTQDATEDEQATSPFILIDTAGGDCEEDEADDNGDAAKASRSNTGEAAITGAVVEHFLTLGLRPGDIGVISPYSAQVRLLRQQSWAGDGRGIEVATIDSFQGREKEVIILSLVRSNEGGQVGFLSDDRRLNVAITRARRCVVVICDSETVVSHPLLARLVDYAEMNGLYRAAVVDFAEVVGTVSQLRRPREAIEAEQRAERTRGSGRTERRKEARDVDGGFAKTVQRVMTGGKRQGQEREKDDDETMKLREGLREQMEKFARNEFVVEKVFSTGLSALERRIVHELAEEMKLHHASGGDGNERRIRVWKEDVALDGIGALEGIAAQLENSLGLDSGGGADSEIGLEEYEMGLADRMQDDGAEVDWFGMLGMKEFGEMEDGEEGKNRQMRGADNEEAGDEDVQDEQGDGEEAQQADYVGSNALLADLRRSRETRGQAGSSASGTAERVQTGEGGKKKRGKRKKKGRRKGDGEKSEDDLDAVLAKYGHKAEDGGQSGGGGQGRFSPAVARIVNGVVTTTDGTTDGTTDATTDATTDGMMDGARGSGLSRGQRREQSDAKRRLAEKLARDAERRKRKVKADH